MKARSFGICLGLLLSTFLATPATACGTCYTVIAEVSSMPAPGCEGFAQYDGFHDVVIDSVAPQHEGLQAYMRARLVRCNLLFDTTVSSCFWVWTMGDSFPLSCGTHYLWKCYNDSKRFQAETDFEIDIVFGSYADSSCIEYNCLAPSW